MQELGKSHPWVRLLRELRSDAATRRQEGVWVAEGVRTTTEALRSGLDLVCIVISERLTQTEAGAALMQQIETRGLACGRVAQTVIERLQSVRSAQPVLSIVKRPHYDPETLVPGGDPPLLLVADGIRDPGNLGSMIRSAEAAGAGACLIVGEGVDLSHPRIVRGSMGSIFRLPTLSLPAVALRPWLDRHGISAVGTDVDAEQSLYDRDLRQPTALVFGNETDGISAPVRDALRAVVRLPMTAGVESLSVGAAAAVTLFEAARQRSVGREG